MANVTTKSQIQHLNSFGLGLGSDIGQKSESLGQSQGLSNPTGDGMKLDPLSIRITLVIVFCIIFLVVVLVVFLVICLKRQKCVNLSRNQNDESSNDKPSRSRYHEGRHRSASNDHHSESSFMNENEEYLQGVNYARSVSPVEIVSKKSFEPRPHQPDIIEAEIHYVPSYHLGLPVYDYAYDHRLNIDSSEQINLQVQCANRNIGLPDINCYRIPQQSLPQKSLSYHEHQDAQEAKRDYFAHHSVGLLPHLVSQSPRITTEIGLPSQVNMIASERIQSAPLARLSPSISSESSQNPVRILTLQDISRKQLQSVLFESTGTSSSGGVSKNVVHSNSDMSWNSPVISQLGTGMGNWHSDPEAQVGMCSGRNGTVEPVRVQMLQTNNLSSDIPPLIQPDDCSLSSSESDDSFTGSEFGDDNDNQEAIFKKTDKLDNQLCHFQPNVIDSSYINNGKYNESETFPDYLSMFISCEDISAYKSNASSSKPLQSLDYFLNWGLNFDSLVDVFQDLADLPDLEPEIMSSKRIAIV